MAMQRVRVFCTTENKEVFWYIPQGQPTPTKCPNDTNHQVDPGSVSVIAIGEDEFQKDLENAQVVRMKQAPTGWHYQMHVLEIETSMGTVVSNKADGTPFGYTTVERRDAGGVVTTDEALAVETRVDWEPPHAYDILGGELRLLEEPASDTRLWIIAAPLIPAAAGGSKEMVANYNLRFLNPKGALKVDGRVSKHFEPNPTYHLSRFRFLFRHPAGARTRVQICVELFKQ